MTSNIHTTFAAHDTTARSRRGVGAAFVIVVALVVIAAIVAFGRSFFSSFVADRTQKSISGDLALDLAINALEEGRFRLAMAANDPKSGNRFFKMFRGRGEIMQGEMTLAQLPVLQQDLETYPTHSLYGGSLGIEVLFQAASSLQCPTPHDRFGTLRMTAEIYDSHSHVFRRLHQVFDYRVSLTAPPRPFDIFTLFIADPGFIVHSWALNDNANDNIDAAMKRLDELGQKNDEFIEMIEQGIDQFEAKSSSFFPTGDGIDEARSNLKQAQGHFLAVKEKWPIVKLLDSSSNTSDAMDSLHRFPDDPFAIASFEDEIDCQTLNLPHRIERRVASITAAEGKLKEAIDNFRGFLEKKPSDLSPLPELSEAYKDSLLRVAREYRGMLLEDYKSFQDTVFEISGKAYHFLDPFIAQLDKIDYRLKATAVLKKHEPTDDTVVSLNEQLEALLDLGDGYHGVIFVENTNEEIIIDRTFKGRTVLVVEGDINVVNARLDDPTQDLLTIICLGQLNLSGPCEASLIPWMGFTCSSKNCTIEGNLILGRPDFTVNTPEELLSPFIKRGSHLRAGPEVPPGTPAPAHSDYLYVTIAPEALFTEIERR